MSARPDTPSVTESAATEAPDPHWYKDAVVYEAHVRAFADSNDDGIGDFRGLASRLDYIQDLGVNTIWLLPFYPSPMKDDGYDIADYHSIHPQYGTMADFRYFVREAHRRGLRVITELVINHTSDQHPWFQAARRAPPGSAKRDFYVWSDAATKYAGTRIIFTDTEASNWAWDPVANAYYWHRFFSHQPDLNFDNPHVERAVIRIMRYWLDQGVDGLRLDAIPYLVERDGTSNENLRETHEVIRRIRRVIDAHYADRMLLAEANQWPEDVRDYFGDGDECHMAYHFPLMPRMYMAIAQEDRYPIVEILQQTPDIPANCQWAIFLRNHDELTLEMVTSRERDYMYQMYAADRRARINLGIRRRLAPLLENDPERIKLMNSLLLSMPGSPIIYYGDEIGMGDNFYLGDRNGVRTPMQWSPDRNAGFSRADPQQLYLPPIMDPVYGYQAVNVESQSRDRSSLLSWMKRMLQVRRTTHAFGRGTLRLIRPGNRKVLGYVREHGDDTVLCVVNLSRSAQPVELDLSAWKGAVPIELLGRTPFPPVGELPYLLTLPAYGFYWFRLSRAEHAPKWHEDRLPRDDVPVLVLVDGWNSFFPERVSPWRRSLAGRLHADLESRLVPEFVAAQRWFAAKGGPVQAARLVEHATRPGERGEMLLALFDVESGADTSRYFVPLTLGFDDADDVSWQKLQAAAIARVRQQARAGVVTDAPADERFALWLVQAMADGQTFRGERGTFRLVPTRAFAELRGAPGDEAPIGPPRAQSSNTALQLGSRLFLKVMRRLRAGTSPEIEIGRFLTEESHFAHVVPLAGSLEYRADDGTAHTLAVLQGFVANQGDGWDYTVAYLARFLEDHRAAAEVRGDPHGGFLPLIATLGRRTAELHQALSAPSAAGDFGSEPITADHLARWRDQALHDLDATCALLSAQPNLSDALRPQAERLLGARHVIAARIAGASRAAPEGLCIRTHGDYHLGQVLLQRNDFVIVDFEGEPERSLPERRRRTSPLRDVAGMLRSFAYARHTAARRVDAETAEDASRFEPLLAAWERQARDTFVQAWHDVARPAGLLASLADARPVLELFEIEKALYELRYELRNRPDWAGIPLASLLTLA